MQDRIHILIVEDRPEDAELITSQLRSAGINFVSERVDTEDEYLAKLNSDVHIILSDFELPQFSGMRALELLKQRPSLNVPFIIVSGTIGEETAVAAIKKGAADYVLKDRTSRLGPAVLRAVREVAEQAEHKRMEEQFIEAQKMEVVGHLAGGVAHDFNNVLAVIIGYTDLIMQDLPPESPLQKYVDEVQHAAKRAAGLTRQLLIFSRKQTVAAVELDINEAVADMEKMLRRLINENIDMTLVCGEGIGLIMADPGYVWQTLMNLVVNARDAMPNGGRIVIKTMAVTLDETYAQAHPNVTPGPYVMMSISDTGIGMTDEVKARLFEAFFTTKPKGKGTGLGLVTCQTIVRQSGGHIDFTSEPGQGTTFRVYFPRIGSSAASAVRSADKLDLSQARGTETILLVEDDPAERHLAEKMLLSQGYEVLTAPNGQDALRVAREHRGQPISLVLTDVIMPQMGGRVMAEWLKATYPDLKVLFTSGYTEEAIAHHGVLDQGVEFLPKPYAPSTLCRKVREMLDATSS